MQIVESDIDEIFEKVLQIGRYNKRIANKYPFCVAKILIKHIESLQFIFFNFQLSFLRLISVTTTFSNQNTLKEEHVHYSVKAAQDLERIISQLVAFKKHFSKLCPYIISEYFFRANTFPIHVNVKVI